MPLSISGGVTVGKGSQHQPLVTCVTLQAAMEQVIESYRSTCIRRLLVLVFYGCGYERATGTGMDIRILLHGLFVPMGISATKVAVYVGKRSK